jgi:hypothetical protein
MMSLKPGDIVTKLKVRSSRSRLTATSALTRPLRSTVSVHGRHHLVRIQCVARAAHALLLAAC